MVQTRGTKGRQLSQLTLVSTPYVAQIVRTVAHVRSIQAGETVSMAEVFRSIVERVAPELEAEIARTLGSKALLPIRSLREAEKAKSAAPEEETEDDGFGQLKP